MNINIKNERIRCEFSQKLMSMINENIGIRFIKSYI